MVKDFQTIISALIGPKEDEGSLSVFDPSGQFEDRCNEESGVAGALNAAFLIALTGGRHRLSEDAESFLARMTESSQWAEIARFYQDGIDHVQGEIQMVCEQDRDFEARLKNLSEWVSDNKASKSRAEVPEKIWSLFFPEAIGIREHWEEHVKDLREKRTVTITELNSTPIIDPARQILFSSNVLLTVPSGSRPIGELPFSDGIMERLSGIVGEPQLYWYDHPIQVGVASEKNEILYGLKGLDEAIEFERKLGNIALGTKVTILLSVSVTHRGLQKIAKGYLEEELNSIGSMNNIDVFVFTEADTRRIVDEVMAPVARKFLHCKNAGELLGMFGVDGEYGRHYSFLKAIAAFWSILIKPDVRATFKIDLDQVFPQKELTEQTGFSAFEHLKTHLWGAYGLDSAGQQLDLGMIAGALVNKSDIKGSLFSPDVVFKDKRLLPDEYIFYSTLPQALSTEAEMMTRYNTDRLDGKGTCIQRIHVTGGTTGILVDSLRRHRPFTPSFMGRAEDQSYILSVLLNPGPRLAYLHKDGLIMRHDKGAFAQEAIRNAYIDKLIGDYVRILYFSAYAEELNEDVKRLKDNIDPFTGCFVSMIPLSIVHMRFGLMAASLFSEGKAAQALEFIKSGTKRIMGAIKFIRGKENLFIEIYKKERLGWNLYYDTLSSIEDGLRDGDRFVMGIQSIAKSIIDGCHIQLKRERRKTG